MSERDYNRQVVKRQRINRATLVVGVDVGNACNAVGFMNKEGNVLESCAKLHNSREGFEQFVKMTEGIKARQGMKDVLIGLEPTAGIGPLSAAIFLGELGDPACFQNARQIVKYAGYDPQESDSGYRVSRKFISKKGRWLLRKCLFFMSMRVVVLSNYFQEYYQRKLQTKNRVGQLPRRKEILCAVAIKLIKVIFALLTRLPHIFTKNHKN